MNCSINQKQTIHHAWFMPHGQGMAWPSSLALMPAPQRSWTHGPGVPRAHGWDWPSHGHVMFTSYDHEVSAMNN